MTMHDKPITQKELDAAREKIGGALDTLHGGRYPPPIEEEWVGISGLATPPSRLARIEKRLARIEAELGLKVEDSQ